MRTGKWRRFNVARPLLAAALAPFALAASVHAEPLQQDRWGFNFCSPPYPPACVDAAGAGPEQTAACSREVRMFVSLVFAYRNCQSRELQRAIAEANRVIDAFECRTGKKPCELPASAREKPWLRPSSENTSSAPAP